MKYFRASASVMTLHLTMLLGGIASGQRKSVTVYAPVDELKMYYEIKGSGNCIVVLSGKGTFAARA